jgi:hypothetical protein
MRNHATRLAAAALCALMFGGCLLVRTTEHRIHLNGDGSGDAVMRFVDIRSDGETDSTVTGDFDELMTKLSDSTGGGFETGTRTITARRLVLDADTLNGEMAYEFAGFGDVEGLRITDDALSVLVSPERVVVKTNGTIEERSEGGVRIVWDRDARELQYEISERFVRPSTSLAGMYRKRTR